MAFRAIPMSPLVGCDAAVFCVGSVALTALGWARWRHNSFHATLSHTDLSHSTLSHTSLSRTQLFHTQLCYLQLSLTHLLRTIFANSDVECILLAKHSNYTRQEWVGERTRERIEKKLSPKSMLDEIS